MMTLADVIHAQRVTQREADIAEMERVWNERLVAFNALPVIITGPGDFVTRDGRRVTIHDVSATRASGSIWKEFRGKLTPRVHRLWDLNGRRSFHQGEFPSDIVGVWAN